MILQCIFLFYIHSKGDVNGEISDVEELEIEEIGDGEERANNNGNLFLQ